ncbi:hypothetical protein ACJIZ3_024902 [Penstemon smallii]|uniref:Uncharacterized protein n=1 Tax=Penstemon smallii TaxID=265156 RepID=A0ABD3TUG8_9LAMI
MELKSCANTHFIQAIRGGVVVKVRNIFYGRPALVCKTLLDIYESEDAKKLGRLPKINSHNKHANTTFDCEQVKCENLHVPVVDRTLHDGLDSDLDDSTTLKQLRERFQTKKRKFSHSGGNSNQVYADVKPEQDDSDLNEPLIYWKSKKPKNLKAKKKHMNGSVVSSSLTVFAIKNKQNLVSESSLEVGAELGPVSCVKVEVQEAEELGCQSKTSFAYDSSHGLNEEPNHAGVVSNEFQKMVQQEFREPLFSAEEHQHFVINEIFCDHLEDIEPISILVPCGGVIKSNTPELNCHEFLDLPPLALEMSKEIIEDHSCRSSPSDSQNSDVFSHSRSSSSMEGISEQISDSGLQVPDKSIDGTEEDLTDERDDSLSIPNKNCGSSLESIDSLKMNDNLICIENTIADEEQTLSCTLDDNKKNGPKVGRDMDDELLKSESSSNIDVENQSCQMNKTSDIADTLSSPEPCHPPGRLLSKRKIISPSSQEQLCLAMNSVEICNDVDQYQCQEKFSGKNTEKKASSVRSDTAHAKTTASHGGPGQCSGVSQRKFIISPRHTIKKSRNAKGNLEGPRFARKLPNFSTGCSSVQGCSESAVAFSERQMHDMETLAVKLINELNSMKDMVEQKLLFESYRSVSLKNDADEVKSAIRNATKVEETAQKWLKMMSRDCNRFCKIMELTPDKVVSSKDAVLRERKKKIMFADEAGGELCHVKLFEVGSSSPVSEAVKQESQSI